MKRSASWVLKAVALWIVLIAATIGTGLLLPPPVHAGQVDGPFQAMPALLLVTAAGALVLASLAPRLTSTGWRRPVILLVVLFGVETFLSWVEAVFFNAFLQMSDAALASMVINGLIRAAIAASVAALLWRRPAQGALQGTLSIPRFVTLTSLYVVLYFVAGSAVAWSSEAVRIHYGEGLTIEPVKLVLLQVARGAAWTALAALLAATMSGPRLTVAALTGFAFAVLMTAPLLYPSAIIPWPVRQVHVIEIALSNFAFGFLAICLLLRQQVKQISAAIR